MANNNEFLDIEKEQMIAGLELGTVHINSLKNRTLSPEDIKEALKDLQKMILPERFKHVTKEMLIKMRIDDYDADVSMLMLKNYKERHVIIKIPDIDIDLINPLIFMWTDRKFEVHLVSETKGDVAQSIEITW